MTRHVALLVAGLAIGLLLPAASGCGTSKERQIYNQRRDECASLHGLTLADVRQTFDGTAGQVFACSTVAARLAGDTCAGGTGPYDQSVCQILYAWVANDPGLCGANGCVYSCEVRVEETDLNTNDLSALVCASVFHGT